MPCFDGVVSGFLPEFRIFRPGRGVVARLLCLQQTSSFNLMSLVHGRTEQERRGEVCVEEDGNDQILGEVGILLPSSQLSAKVETSNLRCDVPVN